jgi:hypothetical protein
MRSQSVALLLLSVVFAGCASSEGATPQGSVPPGPVASGEPIEDGATIQGIVVDDSQAPLQGAIVGIVGLGLQVQTDLGGSFRFENVPPGSHDIQAARLGFASLAKRVTVGPSQQLDGVILTLSPIPVEVPYVETFGPYAGFFHCMWGSPASIRPCAVDPGANAAVFGADTRNMPFNLTSDNWATMIGESRWTQGAFATGVGMAIYPSYTGRPWSHWWCEADGRSPLIFRYEAADPDAVDGLSICNSQGRLDPMPAMEINPLLLVADPGFGGTSVEKPPLRLMFEQRFELMMSIFYLEPAPPDFSALADA